MKNMRKRESIRMAAALTVVLLTAGSMSAQRMPAEEYMKYTPSYHFYPSGDPTGLFYYDGLYYNNWGIAFSTDFVHWKYTAQRERSNRISEQLRDPDITPQRRDSLNNERVRLGGSGTIVVDSRNTSGLGRDGQPPLVAFYHNELHPVRTQVIGLSYSNDLGVSWKRYEKYPVLNIDSREFRDPKVWWHEPSGYWVMAIGWAEIPKIQFYKSDNLIDWEFMSEFGPWGATGGVWECVDMFPLPVDGDEGNIKWVIAISVQPFNGQYFIGDFDGVKFTMDEDFVQQLTYEKYRPQGITLFDFEHGIDDWEMEGDAFLQSPTYEAIYRQGAIMGKEGNFFINSYHNEARGTGRIVSPEFAVSKNYINFKIGGGYAPGEECVNLLVDGKVVRTHTARNSNDLQWVGWDVQEFRGRTARVEIVDALSEGTGYSQGAGYIYADHFMLSDELAFTGIEKAFWFDYGPDFFAVRSWNNYAPGENRVVWTAWMGSWRYASVEPVGRIQSVPREVKLKTFPEGVRLVQSPIAELQTLRGKKYSAQENTFEGVWVPKRFAPSRNAYELIVEIENISAEEFGLKLCVGEGEKTTVGYVPASEELYVDRRDSGFDDFTGLFPEVNGGPLKRRGDNLKLHIFVDNCSIEVFANDGETTISSKIYPDAGSVGIEFFSSKGKIRVKSAEMYELGGINLHE